MCREIFTFYLLFIIYFVPELFKYVTQIASSIYMKLLSWNVCPFGRNMSTA